MTRPKRHLLSADFMTTWRFQEHKKSRTQVNSFFSGTFQLLTLAYFQSTFNGQFA